MQRQASRNTLSALDHEAVIIDKLNSSKMQRFFGVEIESSSDYRTNTISHLFNNNQRKGTRRRRRTVKRRQSPSFQQSHEPRASSVGQLAELSETPDVNASASASKKASRLVSWFNQLQSPPSAPVPLSSAGAADHSWRPLLPEIYAHPPLLIALQAFMERIFCVENLLFLQSARRCHALMDDLLELADGDGGDLLEEAHMVRQLKRIDAELASIFDAFIVRNAQFQINVSYDCLRRALAGRQQLRALALEAKRHVLVPCVEEIEKLMLSSVLSPFYESAEFTSLARQRLQRLRGLNKHAKSRKKAMATSQPVLCASSANSARADEWSRSLSRSMETGTVTLSEGYDAEVRAMSEFSMNCISDEEDEEEEVPPLSMLSKSASSPPIKLNMSHSTESAFSFEYAKSAKSAKSASLTTRSDSDHLCPMAGVAVEARTRGSSTPMPSTACAKSAPDREATWNGNPFSPKRRAKAKAKAKRGKRGNPFGKKRKEKGKVHVI